MSRTPLIAANWKMNPPPTGWADAAIPPETLARVEVLFFPSFLDIRACIAAGLHCGGQYGRAEEKGAFTGDVSLKMLKDAGCMAVLCGHSERRKNHGETDEQVAAQADTALDLGLHPIVCVGETLEERNAGKHQEVVKEQLKRLPLGVTVAYEPVWAIGTGVTATPEQAQEMHAFIRSLLPGDARDTTRILYGGSMNAANAKTLLDQPDVDGGLVGSASLNPQEFAQIIAAAIGSA